MESIRILLLKNMLHQWELQPCIYSPSYSLEKNKGKHAGTILMDLHNPIDIAKHAWVFGVVDSNQCWCCRRSRITDHVGTFLRKPTE